MLKRLKFRLLAAAILAAGPPASAGEPDVDTVMYHAADSAVSLGGIPEEEAGPDRTIIYNTARPTDVQWEAATSHKAYSYRDLREFSPKKEAPPKVPGWYKAIIAIVEFLSSAAGHAVLWISLALIVGFVALRILRGQGSWIFGRRDVTPASGTPDEGLLSEEGLLEADWAARLRSAIEDGDSRLAIRYSYLDVLQSLQQRGLIAYRQDKTNAAYARELPESMQAPFRAISRQYEYAWYGAFLPGPQAMDSYMVTYHGMKKSISYA